MRRLTMAMAMAMAMSSSTETDPALMGHAWSRVSTALTSRRHSYIQTKILCLAVFPCLAIFPCLIPGIGGVVLHGVTSALRSHSSQSSHFDSFTPCRSPVPTTSLWGEQYLSLKRQIQVCVCVCVCVCVVVWSSSGRRLVVWDSMTCC